MFSLLKDDALPCKQYAKNELLLLYKKRHSIFRVVFIIVILFFQYTEALKEIHHPLKTD